MHLSELKALHISALVQMAETLEIENASRLRKQELQTKLAELEATEALKSSIVDQALLNGAQSPVTCPCSASSHSQ